MESQLDFAAGTYGKVFNFIVHFTRITGGDDTGKWTATVRLLGVTGEQREAVERRCTAYPVLRMVSLFQEVERRCTAYPVLRMVSLFQEGADEAVFEGGEWLVTHREVKPCRFVDYAFEM